VYVQYLNFDSLSKEGERSMSLSALFATFTAGWI